MPQRVLGHAKYKAYRLLGVVTLSATGEHSNLNDKADFSQLPFLIYPPMWAFYEIKADISLPATVPFTYEETISFPKSAKSIRIQDADGFHDVPIAEVVVPDFDAAATTAEAGAQYCVFQWIGINPLMIAKCDAPVPAVYTRVFGPASHDDCKKYVKDNGGI
ncbi:MAG: hypothetical protein HY244_13775 [Rhizobiales bacterium]|nr:hypothetical protein [Hyphomicrobiales bacterium]